MHRVREERFPWLEPAGTTIVESAGKKEWWTFAGLAANSAIRDALRRCGIEVGRPDNFAIEIRAGEITAVDDAVEKVRLLSSHDLRPPVTPKHLDDRKFSICVPLDAANSMLERRLADDTGVLQIQRETVRHVRGE